MKSTVASLRSLTLPFGATTGGRIELDGVIGEIRIYDSNGNLQIKLSPDYGVTIFDDLGNIRLNIGTIFGGAFSIIELSTAAATEDTAGVVSLYDTGSSNRLVTSPGNRGYGCPEWTIISGSSDNTGRGKLQAVFDNLPAGALRPYIDLTGNAAHSEGRRAYTVVYDLLYGTPNATYGNDPTIVGAYPKGIIQRTAISAGQGGITTVVDITGLSLTFTADSLKTYRFGLTIPRGIASTAANDLFRLQITDSSNVVQEEFNVTLVVANRSFPQMYTSRPFTGLSGSITRKIRMLQAAGAGTGTFDAAATQPATFWVEDCGYA